MTQDEKYKVLMVKSQARNATVIYFFVAVCFGQPKLVVRLIEVTYAWTAYIIIYLIPFSTSQKDLKEAMKQAFNQDQT